MAANAILATSPVTVPGTAATVYNGWFMTQLIMKATLTSCPTIVHLHRAALDANNNVTSLMPNGPGAEISFRVDIFQQLTAFPAF